MRTLTNHKKLFNSPHHYIQDKTKCSVRIARIPQSASGTPSLVTDGSSSQESLYLQQRINEPRVLISVAVDSSAKEDPLAWLEWLNSHMPDYITGVKLEGLFGSHSTLGIFSIPVRAWDFLADNAAYTFVSFTTTSNLINALPNPEKAGVVPPHAPSFETQFGSEIPELPVDVYSNFFSGLHDWDHKPIPINYYWRSKLLSDIPIPMLNTINSLGNLYIKQGKLAEAEEMYLRALKGYEKALGPEHTSTLLIVNNLGGLYSDQGKRAEAEEMYLRALMGYEKALGPEHTSTLNTVGNLGNLYSKQGKLAEAEEMYLRALKGYEKALGPEHTSTLLIVNNLGGLYKNQGKLARAEEMYLRALKGYEKALGPEHTSTLGTVNNLGGLYKNRGKLARAEEMYLRALKGYEKALGPEHTSTLGTVNNLGLLYKNQGKLARAEEMYLRALKGQGEGLRSRDINPIK
jgi:tetratricopeptide (TPR) repeat protein